MRLPTGFSGSANSAGSVLLTLPPEMHKLQESTTCRIFVKEQRTNLAEFNESLAKRWLGQITVWGNYFTVELKSGLKIDIEG